MRWPWQRERTEPSADDGGRELPQQAAPPPRVPPAGWAFLQPLQRTTTNMQLISAPDHFTDALAAWSDPSFTSPMAHLVSTAAPAGIVDVDGGGPVRGDGVYQPSSVEMTLLPPPAPGSRPAPPKASHPGSLQRSASDGATSAGAPGPVGPALTAAAGTFPVLQLLASPPEQARAPSEHAAATEQAQDLPEQETNASEGLPAMEVAATRAAEDISSVAIAPTSSQPIRTVGSTSDGNATYVPLPPPAVQRAQPGTPDATPAKWKVPPASKLGLGVPLAYSEPAGPPESYAAAALRHIPPPVQRSAAPEPSKPVPVTPIVGVTEESHPAEGDGRDGVDGDRDHGTGAGTVIAPISGDPVGGTVHLPLLSPPTVPQPLPAVPVQATDTGSGDASTEPGDETVVGPADVEPSTVPPERTLDDAGDDRHKGPLNGQENHEQGMPLESAVAPLLSTGGLGESIGGADQGGPAGAPATHTFDGGTPSGMPVVSRFGPAATDKPGPEDAPGEPAMRDAADVPGRPVELLAVPPDAGLRGTLPNDERESATGHATTPEAPAVNAVLPLQRAVEPATGHPLSSTSAALGTATPMINTTPQSNTAPQRAFVFRMARTATASSTPDSVQRLAEMPAALQPATLSPGSPTAATPRRAAQGSPSAAAPDALPSFHGYPEPDAAPLPPRGLPGIDRPESAGGLGYEPAALHLSLAGAAGRPLEPPEVTAAVGRSIQRTLAPEGAASAAGGVPRPSSDSWRTAALVSAAAGPRAQVGGRGAVNVQRSAASSSASPHPVRPDREGSVLGAGTVPGAAFPEATNVAPTLDNPSGPAVLALALQPASRTGGPSTAPGDATVQRDAADPAVGSRPDVPTQGAGSAGGPSTAASQDSLDAGASVQADAGAPPDGAARPVPGAATAPAGKQAAGAPAATPEQLEELAKRLAGPLIRRIKAEMLLDRERRGLRTDVN